MTSTGPSGSALLGADHVGIIRVSGFYGRVRWENRKTCALPCAPSAGGTSGLRLALHSAWQSVGPRGERDPAPACEARGAALDVARVDADAAKGNPRCREVERLEG